ncbi:MAG TPA: DUF58 domain-containing protein [Limnochordia bacterium]|nr:DUF58 domain-containing protein [Limnochordia bacterium]
MNHWGRALIALGLAALFFRAKMLYVVFYAAAAIYAFARFALPRGFASLSVTRHIDGNRLFVGESTTIRIRVRNSSWVPMSWVGVLDQLPPVLTAGSEQRAIVALAPLGQAEWSYTLSGKRRGVHAVGPITLEAGDPFGIELLTGRTALVDQVVVYPRIHPLVELGLPARLPIGPFRTPTRLFEDPARATGAREYRPGDPFKRIHWKLSAKGERLYVKEYQPTITLDTAILLNLNLPEYEARLRDFRAELGIEAAASIAYHLGEHKQSLRFITNGRDPSRPKAEAGEPIRIAPRKGTLALTTILEVLAKIELGEGRPFDELINESAASLGWGGTLVIITPEDTEALLHRLTGLQHKGHTVMLLITGDVRHKEWLGRPALSGLTLHQLRSETEFERLGLRGAG